MADAQAIIKEWDRLKSKRYNFHRDWQDIVSLVRPNSIDFEVEGTPGESRTEDAFDGTARNALSDMASGLQAFLTNPQDRWFSIRLQNVPADEIDQDASIWLHTVTETIYQTYNRPSSNHQHALQECYLDLGSLGTGSVNQEWRNGGIVFRPDPLSCFWIRESASGTVDTKFRRNKMPARQLIQELGEKALTTRMREKIKDNDYNCEFTILHAVYPRDERNPKLASSKNMPFASVWVCVDTKEVIHEGGYKSFPDHTPRWRNRAGEVYGRSPAHDCLPDIRVLNRMELTNLKVAQKAVDPALIVPDDGFLMPLETAPGSINYAQGIDPREAIHALRPEGDYRFGQEVTEQKREFIKRCFMADLFILELKRAEMTATEVQDRREEQLRRLAPVLGKLTRELLSPMIERTYELLRDHGKLPPAPPSLEGFLLSIEYESPASRAQRGIAAIEMQRYLEALSQPAQFDPSILDAIDTDQYATELAAIRGVNPRIIRPLEQRQSIRTQRAQAEQAAQITQAAEPVSKAIKNVAEAQNVGSGSVLGL